MTTAMAKMLNERALAKTLPRPDPIYIATSGQTGKAE